MKRKRRGLVAHGRGGTQAPTRVTPTHARAWQQLFLLGHDPILYYCYDFACGYEQRRRRDSFMWFCIRDRIVWADAACVCLREALRGQRHHGGSAHRAVLTGGVLDERDVLHEMCGNGARRAESL